MKKSVLTILAVFFAASLMISCGDEGGSKKSSASGDSDVSTDSEKTDEDLVEDKELSDNEVEDKEVADNEIEDKEGDSDVVKPSPKPGDDFFTPEKNAVYTYKGAINKYEDLNSPDINGGVMDVKVKLDSIDVALNDMPAAFKFTYPDTAAENLKGKTVIGIISVGGIEQKDGFTTYYIFINDFNLENLTKLKADNKFEFTQAEGDSNANLQKIYLKERADKSRVVRKCVKGVIDKNSDSKFFINHTANKTFDIGENIFVWANIGLTSALSDEMKAALTEYEGEYCTFTLDQKPITKDEYEAELVKDVTQFDCNLPENYLTKPVGDYGLFKFKGKLVAGVSLASPGIGNCEVSVDGNVIKLEDNLLGGVDKNQNGDPIVVFTGVGNIEILTSQSHYKFDMFQAIMTQKILADEKAANKESCIFTDIQGNENFGVYYTTIENKDSTGKTYQKACTQAVTAAAPAESSIFMCIKNNTSFAIDEEIQIAGNISINNDETYILEQLGTEGVNSLCTCVVATQTSADAIDCAEFDKIVP